MLEVHLDPVGGIAGDMFVAHARGCAGSPKTASIRSIKEEKS